jgi:hypothetical protein
MSLHIDPLLVFAQNLMRAGRIPQLRDQSKKWVKGAQSRAAASKFHAYLLIGR